MLSKCLIFHINSLIIIFKIFCPFDINIQGGITMDKLGIIGLGNMGEAMLKALLNNGFKKEAIVCTEVKTDKIKFIEKQYGVKPVKNLEELINKATYVILAIKPQDSKELLNNIKPFINEKKLIISIMAGVTISNIMSVIGKPVKVVRAMPNVCVKVSEGTIGIAQNKLVLDNELEEIKKILAPLGKTVEVGEELMDAVTAIGGSGPAFFLLFLEAMIDAGVKLGIPRDKSKIISAQVVKGTVKMLEEEGLHPTLMKEMITSPGGTTISGLAHLEERAFKGNIIKAIEESAKRAKELSL
jgi:pyrroline-5-carboxylate reductase